MWVCRIGEEEVLGDEMGEGPELMWSSLQWGKEKTRRPSK